MAGIRVEQRGDAAPAQPSLEHKVPGDHQVLEHRKLGEQLGVLEGLDHAGRRDAMLLAEGRQLRVAFQAEPDRRVEREDGHGIGRLCRDGDNKPG